MIYSLWLKLATIGTLATSVLTMLLAAGVPATATSSTETTASCDLPTDSGTKSSVMPHVNRGTLVASSTGNQSDYPFLDFSAAESDAAVTLFGCDCPSCINALRQLRLESLLHKDQEGHCWTSLEGVSSQEVQEVLESLEAEEAKEANLGEW
ncbi:MAG: hypothetical protein F6K31_01630 [Symploca sp. SIO2G7]|nr:hypothetical protein [Symploca sp. SIO2G7]